MDTKCVVQLCYIKNFNYKQKDKKGESIKGMPLNVQLVVRVGGWMWYNGFDWTSKYIITGNKKGESRTVYKLYYYYDEDDRNDDAPHYLVRI